MDIRRVSFLQKIIVRAVAILILKPFQSFRGIAGNRRLGLVEPTYTQMRTEEI